MDLVLIQSKIYELRGQKVMLDFDLSDLYGIETGQLKRSVRRNIERFVGDDFMFELTKEELSRCQFGFLNKGRGQNFKYLPFAFTELGVAMLSSVLNSQTAIEINRAIMRAFVATRNYLSAHQAVSKEISELWSNIRELETRSEENLRAINDLGEDTQNTFDEIYIALTELAKEQNPLGELAKQERNPVGYIKPKD